MDEFTDYERKYMDRLTIMYRKLFADLRNKGKIKDVPMLDQLRSIIKIIKMMDDFSHAYNAINEIFHNRKEHEFAEVIRPYKISSENLAHIWYKLAVFGFMNQTELLKSCMLLILSTEKRQKKKQAKNCIAIYDDETLGSLLNKLSRISSHGIQLREEVNIELRNAIVHGRYWIEGDLMYYARDQNFSEIQTMKLADFITKQAKRHNLICQSFIRFFPRWYRKMKSARNH